MIIDNRLKDFILELARQDFLDSYEDMKKDSSYTKKAAKTNALNRQNYLYQVVAALILFKYPQVAGYMFTLYKDLSNTTLTEQEQQEQNAMTIEHIKQEESKLKKALKEGQLKDGEQYDVAFAIDRLNTLKFVCKYVIDDFKANGGIFCPELGW